MIFRQLFEPESSTYTYLIADEATRSAVIIDPVKKDVPKYLQLISELELTVVYAIDTHVHADHITGTGPLCEHINCESVMGEQSKAKFVHRHVHDGEKIAVGNLTLKAMHTPGHTDDSYCFVMDDRVFTGDTLLIRGTGRTDFQNSDAKSQYDSIFKKLLKLPDSTLVYPGHDYNGMTVSTIGEERAHNPRLQVPNREAYVELMNNLNLPHPKQMDVAVPANLTCGLETENGRAA